VCTSSIIRSYELTELFRKFLQALKAKTWMVTGYMALSLPVTIRQYLFFHSIRSYISSSVELGLQLC
jgi:hypothetical protein